jgi:2-polyprenyl-3-methyl-5-hydroxy-6-metoxy-1,4-benzoquinol methylase
MNEHVVTAGDRLEEDVFANMARVSAIANRLCDGCADYHVGYVCRRATSPDFSILSDRTEIIEMIGRELGSRAETNGPIDILIAGASDTGLLATAAMGAAAAGPEIAARARFTVIDRCGTPLELCRAYAAQAKLNLNVAKVDLTKAEADFSADLICVHSVFRFLSPDIHVTVLQRLARWLKPQGRIVFSQRLTEVNSLSHTQIMATRIERVAEAVTANPKLVSEPLDDFLARLERMVPRALAKMEFSAPDEVRRLFDAAGVRVTEERLIDKPREGKISHRIVALLAPESAGAS